jgi:hypothetical protein
MANTVKSYLLEGGNWLLSAEVCTQLMEISGRMYVSIEDTADLTEVTVDMDLQEADLTDEVLLHTLRSESMPCKFINSATDMAIREAYSVEGEIQALRTDDAGYRTFVSNIVDTAALSKNDLGLVSPTSYN